jgi:hypothetical protein
MNIFLRKVFSQHFNPSTLQLFNLSTLSGSIPHAARRTPDPGCLMPDAGRRTPHAFDTNEYEKQHEN